MIHAVTRTDGSCACGRTWKLLGILLVLFIIALALPVGAPATSGWSLQSPGTMERDLSGVAFANASDGWAVGVSRSPLGWNGIILATTNGGATWTAQPVEALSAKVGFLTSITCANASVAWAVGYDITGTGFILATTNGGATWTPQDAGTTRLQYLTSITCANASVAWAVGEDMGTGAAIILATTNGGATWTPQDAGTTPNQYLTAVTCANASVAWAVGNDQTSPGADGASVIIATTNGGATWIAQSAGTAKLLRGVACGNTSDAWAVGGGGSILATTNGGTTWKPQDSGCGANLIGVSFADADHGWAVGDNASTGIILATTDGGATWRRQSPPTTDWLHSIACANTNDVWAVGGNPYINIIATTNGGRPPVPRIATLSPTAGHRGRTVVITGSGFGTRRSTSYVKFGAIRCGTYLSWSRTRIKCRVPVRAAFGKVYLRVTTMGGASNSKAFTVRR